MERAPPGSSAPVRGCIQVRDEAVLLDDPVDDDDERAGRAADLHPAAAEQGDQKSGDRRRDEPAIRRDPRRNRKGKGERNRDDPDDEPGLEVGEKLMNRVTAQSGYRLGPPRSRIG
jgi:hypothetical protein